MKSPTWVAIGAVLINRSIISRLFPKPTPTTTSPLRHPNQNNTHISALCPNRRQLHTETLPGLITKPIRTVNPSRLRQASRPRRRISLSPLVARGAFSWGQNTSSYLGIWKHLTLEFVVPTLMKGFLVDPSRLKIHGRRDGEVQPSILNFLRFLYSVHPFSPILLI